MSNTENQDVGHLLSLVRTGDWLDAQEFPPVRWAVPGLIPQGFGLLTGPPKIGKSWAVLDAALAVATGGTALGRLKVGPPRPVFYLALEDGDARLQERSRKLLAGQPIPALFTFVTDGVTPAVVLYLIDAWLSRNGSRQPLVILDTLGKVMPPALPGEGAYQRDYRIGGVLKQLVGKHPGATLTVVHHVRKVASSDWMDSTSGTNGLNGAADWTLNLHRERNQTAGVARVTGRDVAENEYAMTCTEGLWQLDGHDLTQAARTAADARVTAGLGDRSAAILTFVAEHGGPVAPKDVEAALDLPDARRYLARLAAAGRLIRADRGLYTPVPTVPVSQDPPALDAPPLSQRESGRDNGTVGTGVAQGQSA